MSDPTPATPQCALQRADNTVATQVNSVFETWPGNVNFTAPLLLRPKTLAQLANAVLQAERAGHHVRAFGSKWSFGDAVSATTGNPPRPGAMIATDQLKKYLKDDLPLIVAAGMDPTFLWCVEAGMKATALTSLLGLSDQMLEAGGASGQSIAGMMSTSTHSADSLVPPFVEYIRAIHLVGAGGIEYWIERDERITDPARLQNRYPCLAAGNIHYNTRLFNAVVVSAGSMGVIYSVIIEVVPIFAVRQHRVATTWEKLVASDPDLSLVMSGSYMQNRAVPYTALPFVDIFGQPNLMFPPFEPNTFSQIVINPYPFYANDATLLPLERASVGEHLCIVTNRAKLDDIPATPNNPPSDDTLDSMADGMGHAARNALGSNFLDADIRFNNFKNSVANLDISSAGAALVDFLADHWAPGTISAVIHYILQKILPVGDRWDTNLSEVVVWNNQIRGFGVEAAFPVPGAIAYVQQVLDLVAAYAARQPQAYVGGYLSLRIVGRKTNALLGMQRWSPTCCVEYIGIAGTRDLKEFVDDLQKLALSSGGILHLGLENNVMTAAEMRNAFGSQNIDTFRRARGVLSQNGRLTTFDNSFTDRLGLSAIKQKTDISSLLSLLLSPSPLDDGDRRSHSMAAVAAVSTLLLDGGLP